MRPRVGPGSYRFPVTANPVYGGASNPRGDTSDRRIRSYSDETPSRGVDGDRVSRLSGSTTVLTGETRPGPGDGKFITPPEGAT